MSDTFRYENIQVVLGEQNLSLRTNIRSVLHDRGFRNIIDASDMDALVRHMTDPRTDMVLADVNLTGGDFCDAVHRLRHHVLGNNPFVVTMATTSDPTVQLVRRTIDSGVDDLLVKPLTGETLLDRIQSLARMRKPFVVTHDYIGPDRRKTERADDRAKTELIDVPNPLGLRARGQGGDLQRIIDRAAARMNIEKMQRYSVQIPFLVNRIQSYFLTGEGTRDLVEQDLQRLAFVCRDLGRRLVNTAYDHVGELATSMIKLVDRLIDEADPSHAEMQVLDQMARAIHQAFVTESAAAETAREISGVVSNYVKR